MALKKFHNFGLALKDRVLSTYFKSVSPSFALTLKPAKIATDTPTVSQIGALIFHNFYPLNFYTNVSLSFPSFVRHSLIISPRLRVQREETKLKT